MPPGDDVAALADWARPGLGPESVHDCANGYLRGLAADVELVHAIHSVAA